MSEERECCSPEFWSAFKKKALVANKYLASCSVYSNKLLKSQIEMKMENHAVCHAKHTTWVPKNCIRFLWPHWSLRLVLSTSSQSCHPSLQLSKWCYLIQIPPCSGKLAVYREPNPHQNQLAWVLFIQEHCCTPFCAVPLILTLVEGCVLGIWNKAAVKIIPRYRGEGGPSYHDISKG